MDFDFYISEICHPSCSKTAISSEYYKRVQLYDLDYVTMFVLFPLQHIWGEIDILDINMSKSDKKVLKSFSLVKISDVDLKLKLDKIEANKKVELRRKVRLPPYFQEWPCIFELISEIDDDIKRIEDKKSALRKCLNDRISYMQDHVYGNGPISESYLIPQLDFILNLQILAAKYDA